jgi:hypothetical protein
MGNSLIKLHFIAEEAKFILATSQVATEWIFHDRGQSAVCHYKTALSSALEMVCEQAEGIGIALKVDKVVPFVF